MEVQPVCINYMFTILHSILSGWWVKWRMRWQHVSESVEQNATETTMWYLTIWRSCFQSSPRRIKAFLSLHSMVLCSLNKSTWITSWYIIIISIPLFIICILYILFPRGIFKIVQCFWKMFNFAAANPPSVKGDI